MSPLPHFNIKWTSLPLTCILYLLIHRAVYIYAKKQNGLDIAFLFEA